MQAFPGDVAPKKQRKYHFTTHDGKSGIMIYPDPVTLAQVKKDCIHQFGERFKEAARG